MSRSVFRVCGFLLLAVVNVTDAAIEVVTSSDPESNARGSFVYVPGGQPITQGITTKSKKTVLPPQIPFSASLVEPLTTDQLIVWEVYIPDKAIGRLTVVSPYPGKYHRVTPGRLWRTEKLSAETTGREQFEFQPRPQEHQTPLYKKGRSKLGERRQYGGGTKKIDDYIYNPRMIFVIRAFIYQGDVLVDQFEKQIQQDDKDLLRQEYINHFGRSRYGRGDDGNTPVPYRSELSEVPKQDVMAGVGFSQSVYPVMVDDGLVELAKAVVATFDQKRREVMADRESFVDLSGEVLPVTTNDLWLSSGWRNPERNEWFSNAINGIHQRGGALDIVPSEAPRSRIAAASYWLLWTALEEKKGQIPGYWQLEFHGRPMKTEEYRQDVQPENGIPDAFDIADHLHIQLELLP